MSRLILEILSNAFLFVLFLFVPAGTFHWLRAWILVAVLLLVRTISTIIIIRVSPDVLIERAKIPIHSQQPLIDKILLPSFMGMFAALVGFVSFDVFHLHLFPAPPQIISSLGMIFFFAGWCLITLALRTNAFAITVIRNQEERQHTVVDRGVYRWIRHPMYIGLALVLVGIPLWLESYAGALFALLPISILIIRIHVEENFLKKELKGYQEYVSRVHWRLIPGIW